MSKEFPKGSREYSLHKNNRIDLIAYVRPTENGDGFQITLSAPNEGEGILIHEGDDPDTASENGYQSSVSLLAKDNEEVNKILFFKGRTPTVYARLDFTFDLKLVVGGLNNISAKVYTNMEGLRNVVYDVRYTQKRQVEQLDQEIAQKPTAEALSERAKLKGFLGDEQGAITDLEQATRLKPESKDFFDKQIQYFKKEKKGTDLFF